jgi:SAM-dependent methyltransferase
VRTIANTYPSSSTRSITDSIFSSIEENGRLYHSFKDGKYLLPNDEQEQARLDLQHHIFGLTLDGKLTTAPIEEAKLHNVLDVGTGTGIWAIDFATEHPEAKVIGIDLSAVQPRYVPPNLEFQICDAEEEWDFSTKFDYVHWRMMGICFRDFKEVFRHAFDALAPGGIIECQDCSFPMKSDDGSHIGTPIDQWFGYVLMGMEKLGKSFGTEPKNYKSYLEEIGFVDVHVDIRRWPVGPWMEDRKNKELGLWVRADGLDVMQGGSLAILTRGMGWSPQQVEVFLVDCRKAFMNRNIHGYMDV